MKSNYPWYDSQWLTLFGTAQEIIREHYPNKLEQFVESFKPLRTPLDFKTREIGKVFDQRTFEEIRDVVKGVKTSDYEKHELLKFGRLVVHNLPFFNRLQESLVDLVSESVGEEVESGYNFLSMYLNFGVCKVHMDAPQAKWTLDVCIDQTVTWPIYLSQVQLWPEHFESREKEDWEDLVLKDPRNSFTGYVCQPGDGLVFSGSSQWHYRDRIPGKQNENSCSLIFFHFIPKGMKRLVDPANWPELFGVSELQQIHTPR